MAEPNINSYYWETVSSIVERAQDMLKDGSYGDRDEVIMQAIDDELIYYVDQAYIKAYYIITCCPNWNDDIRCDAVYEMLYSDVMEELEEQEAKNEKQS